MPIFVTLGAALTPASNGGWPGGILTLTKMRRIFSMLQPRRQRLIALAAVVFLAGLYLPGLLGGMIPCFRDNLSHHLGWRLMTAGQLQRGILPLVDPLTTCGGPLLADPNTLALYPSTLLYLVFPPAIALTMHELIHHILLALGAFLLLRRLGRSRRGALAGASFAAGAGLAVSQLAFTNSLAALAWIPWLVRTAVRPPSATRPLLQRIAAASVFGALAWLAGEPVIAAMGWILWLAVLFATAPSTGTPVGKRLPLLAAPALALLLAAPVLLPFSAIYPTSRRAMLGLPQGSVAADAFSPRRWPEILLPHLYGAPGPFRPDGFWAAPSFPWLRYEVNLHVGTLALVLLTFGCADRRSRIWTFVGVAAVLAAAAPGAIEAVARVIPPLRGFRYAIKLLLLGYLAAVPIIARGVAAALRRPKTFRRRCVAVALLAVCLAAPMLTPGAAKSTLGAVFPASAANLGERGVARSVSASARIDLLTQVIPLAAAAVSPRVLLIPSLIAQLYFGGRSMLIRDHARNFGSPSPVLAALAEDPRVVEGIAYPLDRLNPKSDPAATAPVARARLGFAQGWRYYGTPFAIAYRLAEGPDGLEPWWSADSARRFLATPPAAAAHTARHLGAAWILRSDRLPSGPDVVRVTPFEAAGARVMAHRLARPSPACWLARREIRVPGRDAAWHQLEDPSSQPGRDAVTVSSRVGERLYPPGAVALLDRSPSRWTLETDSPAPGLLVLDQSYSPQWRVRVDGHPVEPTLVNLCRLGVRVPSGRHRVLVRYSTRPFWAGLALALLALLMILAAWIPLPRPGRRRPSDVPAPTPPATPPVR